MSRSRLDLHGQAELFEAPNETPSDLAFVAPFEVVGAEFLVLRLLVQDVIRSGQHGGSDGENGFLGAAPTLEAEKLRAKVRVPRAGRQRWFSGSEQSTPPRWIRWPYRLRCAVRATRR